MKAYLATTGTIFGLLAILHASRIVAEWNHLMRQPWYFARHRGDWRRRSRLVDLGLEFVPEEVGRGQRERG